MTSPLTNSYSKFWQEGLPKLTLYTKNRFYKILGPFIIGIDFINLPHYSHDVKPHFVIYPLWKKDIKSCFERPFVYFAYQDERGLVYSFSSNEMNYQYLDKVLENMKVQTPILFEDEVSIKEILNIFDKYSKKPPLSFAPNSYLQAVLQEDILEILLIASNNIEFQNQLSKINEKNWDIDHFNLWSVNMGKWLQNLPLKMNQKNEFLNWINENKEEKKIKKLKCSEIKI